MAKITIGDVGKILDLGGAVTDILKTQADKKTTDITHEDVKKIAPQVTKQVEAAAKDQVKAAIDDAQAQLDYKLNQEGPMKSWATQGSLIGIVGAAWTIWTLYSNGIPDGWESYSGPIGVLVGAATTLYGRWVANKPIGQ